MSRPIEEMVEELERLLHEELPQAARTTVADFQSIETPTLLQNTVAKLEGLQCEIGMATFAAMRKGGTRLQYPALPIAEFVPETEFPATDEFSIPGTSPTPPEGFEPPVAPRPKCRGCSAFASGACPNCNLPFCPKHVNPVTHPCGEL